MPLPAPQQLNILVVDDMPNMRRSIKAMLKLLGIGRQIFEAANGREAWEFLEATNTPIHFIISDWNMPEMSGTELLHHTRSRPELRDLPFLMITAEANKEVVAEAAENDVDAYLTKPFVTASLEQKITQLLDKANNPDPTARYLQEARNQEEAGRLDTAVAILEAAIRENDRPSRPFRELGRLYLKQNRPQAAEEQFLAAILRNQLDVTSFHYLGQIAYQRGELDRAITFFTRAMDISPRHADRAIKFASLLCRKGLQRQAEKIFHHVAQSNWANTELQLDIARRCLAGDLPNLAVRLFKERLRANPEQPDVERDLGLALSRLGRHQEAFDLLTRAVCRRPKDPALLLAAARSALALKKPVQAEKFAVKVIRLDSTNREARAILDQCG